MCADLLLVGWWTYVNTSWSYSLTRSCVTSFKLNIKAGLYLKLWRRGKLCHQYLTLNQPFCYVMSLSQVRYISHIVIVTFSFSWSWLELMYNLVNSNKYHWSLSRNLNSNIIIRIRWQAFIVKICMIHIHYTNVCHGNISLLCNWLWLCIMYILQY